jgi:fatty-acyl-CoA synthase
MGRALNQDSQKEICLDDLRRHLADRLPKWWLPDEIRIVDRLPLGATGKVDKKNLREEIY